MTVLPWLRLLARNRFAVSPGRLPMALAVSALSLGQLRRRRGCSGSATAGPSPVPPSTPPPLFIVGHWRTGTTMLHELLALDPQFRCPTTYECMAPAHFLVTGGLVTRHLGRLLPPHRPLDEMRLRWDLPQEDEFALRQPGGAQPLPGLGLPAPAQSPGRSGSTRAIFPPPDRRALAASPPAFPAPWPPSGPGPPRPQVAPAHRPLGLLAEMFPGAGFVHAVRDPYQMVPSFLVAWRRMAEARSASSPDAASDLDDSLLASARASTGGSTPTAPASPPAGSWTCATRTWSPTRRPRWSGIYERLGLPHAGRIPALVEALPRRGRRLPAPTPTRPPPSCAGASPPAGPATPRRYGYRLDPPRRLRRPGRAGRAPQGPPVRMAPGEASGAEFVEFRVVVHAGAVAAHARRGGRGPCRGRPSGAGRSRR